MSDAYLSSWSPSGCANRESDVRARIVLALIAHLRAERDELALALEETDSVLRKASDQ